MVSSNMITRLSLIEIFLATFYGEKLEQTQEQFDKPVLAIDCTKITSALQACFELVSVTDMLTDFVENHFKVLILIN